MSGDIYEYGPVRFRCSDEALEAGETALDAQLEGADATGFDLTGAAFCGCFDCERRVVTGYWISWTLRMVRDGLIEMVER